MAVWVRVKLQDDTLASNPVAGVNVQFYDAATETFVTSGTTDPLGIVDVLIPGAAYPVGVDYHVRAYKPGCSFGGPKTIKVYEPAQPSPDNNEFLFGDVNIYEVENSPTPGLCRASGFLVQSDGKYLKGIRLIFRGWPPETPRIFYDSLVIQPGEVPHEIEAASEDNGFYRVDLMRGAKYSVVLPGWDEYFRTVLVPDRAGVNLADLLFPIPMVITYDNPGPIITPVSTPVTIQASVQFSDYNTYPDFSKYVNFASDNPAVFGIGFAPEGKITITGAAPGIANLKAIRSELTFRTVPTRALVGDTVAVQIT